MLRELERNPEDYKLLLAIQQKLIRLIWNTERRIYKFRERIAVHRNVRKQAQVPTTQSRRLKGRIKRLEQRIESERALIFTWKCFGDGIAFIYLDGFALKHVYYDTKSYVVKQDAGTISGKTGLRLEWKILRHLILKRQLPAVLCDLTNVIRHGDVCVLVGPDPFPIEVKSSKNRNTRVARQIRSLDALREFFSKDEARNFRGVPHVRRVAFGPPVVTQVDPLNACISQSDGKSVAVTHPEAGLQYFCIREAAGLTQIEMTSGGIFCLLNEAKMEQRWMPYRPFTLTIRRVEHLYEFIRGEISLAVSLDTAELTRQFANKEVDVILRPPSTGYPLFMRIRGQKGMSAVSTETFGRLFYEFESLAWFVSKHCEGATVIAESTSALAEEYQSGAVLPNGWAAEMPEEWQRIEAEFDSMRDIESLKSSGPKEN